MEFALSDEQQALRSNVRSFLADRCPASWVRGFVDDPTGSGDVDRLEPIWAEMVSLGWTDLDLVETVIVLEEMGQLPMPGPFLSSVVAANAARRLEIERSSRGTVAIDETGHGDVVDRIRTRAIRKSGAWRLNGEKVLVLDVHLADWILVAARTEQGLGTFLIDEKAAIVPTLDVTRRSGRLLLDDTVAQPVGPDGDHTEIWRRVVDDGAVALSSEMVGSMQRSFDLAVEYAKVRVQFDRPIATFQAIKHKAADMLERIELSRVGVHYAAWASDTDDPARAQAAAMAKSFTGESAIAVTGEGIQIHGGVGFTWDCDEHLHYRRAKSNDLLFGYHGTWRRRVADGYLA